MPLKSYRVFLRPAAERDLDGLAVEVRSRIAKHLQTLVFQPRPHGVKKLAGSDNEWRLRVGDYRILYEIIEGDRFVRIFRIAHRREVYR